MEKSGVDIVEGNDKQQKHLHNDFSNADVESVNAYDEQMRRMVDYYKKMPLKFIEYMGIYLHWYQKIILYLGFRTSNLIDRIGRHIPRITHP